MFKVSAFTFTIDENVGYMGCNNNSEQEFSSKRDVHHAVHVCNPDLKIDCHI